MTLKSSSNVSIDSENPDDLVDFVTNQIYISLADLHETLSTAVGDDEASDILVNALSANLGHIIGQLDVKKQRKYALSTRKTIKEHTLLGAMKKDAYQYGNVGRA